MKSDSPLLAFLSLLCVAGIRTGTPEPIFKRRREERREGMFKFGYVFKESEACASSFFLFMAFRPSVRPSPSFPEGCFLAAVIFPDKQVRDREDEFIILRRA